MRLRMRLKEEDGQSIVLVALAMSIFLIGAVGLGFDGSNLYSNRQKAQLAADSAAQAAMMSIFDGTYNTGSTSFPVTAFDCSTKPNSTPCYYANKNGFATANDTVNITYPGSVTGVTLATGDAAEAVQVTITRSVNTTLMRLLGPTFTNVKATATAAIVSVTSPVPILVVHPTMSGAFQSNGGVLATICGGPHRSIQVNSNNSTATTTAGSGTVDLSKAGPPDPGNCTTGTGADFGVWGGPSTPSFTYAAGSTGKYIQPASWIQDPLASVSAPPVPTNSGSMGTSTALANGVSGCPAAPKKACQLYSPGLWTAGIDGKNSTPVFKPGIYYIQSSAGMSCTSNCDMYMATGFTDTGAGTTGTGWTGNALFYNTGPAASPTNAGAFNMGSNGSLSLTGSPTGSVYQGILFFQDRSSVAQTHSMGGGGAMTLIGTIYLTNTRATMLGAASHYQSLSLQGNPGSSTVLQGEIIVDQLSLGGNAGITMNLSSTPSFIVKQVALVQ